ncbi:MAG: 4-hydroxy-tetrahydrodipicolinate synthase [Clostridia bacterium]|nr:4-hydroxy-tetrahydrodipicolinate synthase [Clostridia bacterium]
MALFKGTATALITPFRDDKVDFASLDRLLDQQLANGVNALVVNGTTGEPTTMTHDERTEVAKFAIKKANGKIPVILGAGSNNTYTAIEYAQEAEKLGANGILVVTPYYNKATQSALVAHYKAIADSVDVPVVLYNVPGRTGVNMLPETVARLCGYKNIVAVKEASGSVSQMMEIKHLCGDGIDLYCGDDGLTFPCMAIGGIGAISVTSNIVPEYFSKMTDALLKKNYEDARERQFRLLHLISALFCEVSPIPVKTAAYWMGIIDSDYMRLPMIKMEKRDVLEKAMEEFGLTFEVKA